MASLSIMVYPLTGERQRFTFQDVPLTVAVREVKCNILPSLKGVVGGNFDLLFGGRVLRDEQSLEACSVTSGSTLVILETGRSPCDVEARLANGSDIPAAVSSRQITEALLYLNREGPYRGIVEEVAKESKTINTIIETVAGLQDDVVAQAVLREPDMLFVLGHHEQAERMFAKHPCLKVAVVQVAAIVKEKAVAAGLPMPGLQMPRQQRVPNQAFQAAPDRLQPAGAAQQQGTVSVITNSQLSAALAAATTASPSRVQPVDGASSALHQAAAQPITQDYFSQVLQQVRGGSSGGSVASAGSHSSASTSSGQSARDVDAQIRQLRDMGIHDEELARRALAAANNNIALALELIYGDGEEEGLD